MYAAAPLPDHMTRNRLADFRSDTVTRPTEAMMAAIMEAEVGDDVYGDDPSTNQLEEMAAAMFGKEAAVFLTSGTQSNLTAVMAHCGRGEEFLIGQNYHIYSYEAGGTAVLGSAFPHPLPVDDRGALAVPDIIAAIKPDDSHHPVTRLLSVENTVSGKVHSLDYMDSMAKTAHAHGLKAHCDGARLMNAVVALDVAPARLVEGFDTVSVCLSKGLGTPAGSVLVGDKAAITKARRTRKMLGGGMRQSGLLAAAGSYALRHHIDRLKEDHVRAEHLSAQLGGISGITVTSAETNMVFARLGTEDCAIDDAAIGALAGFMAERGLRLTPGRELRLVTHLDVSDADIDRLTQALGEFTAHYGG